MSTFMTMGTVPAVIIVDITWMEKRMQENWVVMAKRDDFEGIAARFGIDPVIARLIRNRDVTGDDAIRKYLYGGVNDLEDPFLLKDMDKAVSLLSKKITGGASIRVIGDYDIDGIMAAYILKRGITELGGKADIRIPDRIRDGYGMNENMIRDAARDGIDTVVTCDNGISAHAAVRLAKELGLTVVVTDHHEVEALPEADAVVDPKREDDRSPNPYLCGAAIAWKLIQALGGDPEKKMLQYAAFATVGDLVELKGENRALVKAGIEDLKATDNIGLRSLCDVTGIKPESINTYQIGFILGPCLNASGRLDTAMRALSLLEAENEIQARRIAEDLKELNESRKSLTEIGVREAMSRIEEQGLLSDKVLVVFLPDTHESIAGIIAGRIREACSRPVFVLTRTEDAVKGSGRSIENYAMFDELSKVKDLLLKFGGHPMAAGFTLKEKDLPEFRRRINENCQLTDEDLIPKVRIDVPMPIGYITEELIGQLQLLEPFGKGNEKPLFAQKHVYCDHPRVFGARHTLLKTRVRSLKDGADADPARIGYQAQTEGPEIDAICFRNVDELMKRIEENPDVALVYEPEINDYMGQRRIQIVISHFQ